jgi:hypothetical protein
MKFFNNSLHRKEWKVFLPKNIPKSFLRAGTSRETDGAEKTSPAAKQVLRRGKSFL